MKKLMLLLSTALFFLPACSKQASEPVVVNNESEEEITDINLRIEGEREDAAYTLYLFTNAEKQGGIRFALNNERTNPMRNTDASQNRPQYWDYTTHSADHGKFHNIVLRIGLN